MANCESHEYEYSSQALLWRWKSPLWMRLWIVRSFLTRLALSILTSCPPLAVIRENVVLWRGHFNATGTEKSVNLSINGGQGVLSSLNLLDEE